MKFEKSTYTLCLLLILTACGGGGGSDGSSTSLFATGSGFTRDISDLAMSNDVSGDLYVLLDRSNGHSYDGVPIGDIVRLNSDGSLDTLFIGGTFDTSLSRPLYTMAVATDGSGRIYVGEDFFRVLFVRINADGSNDGGFDSGSGFDVAVNDVIYCIVPAVDGSGDIYVCGGFDDYRGNTRNNIARIHSDGSDDSTFVTGTRFDTIVMDLALATDGSLYVGGHFTDYNGQSAGRIIRLNLTGSPN